MTAVVALPPGWVHMRDPQGNIYYQNNITRETTRVHPANLPPGWTETKDPNGKPFFVLHELQLSSWCRPGQQPVFAASTPSAKPAIPNSQAPRPSLAANTAPNNMRPQSTAMASRPNVQGQRPAIGPRPGQQQVSLATATEATINLLDPSNGGIVRNTKIVGHIAGQSVKGTVKAVTQNQRLQTFARGTGLAMANKKVKKAWRKAAKEVASLDGHRRQEIRVTQNGPQGNIAVQGADTNFDEEYVIEYEDGTVEYYDAKQRLLRTSTGGSQHPPQQNPSLVHRPAIQQRPLLQTQSPPVQGQQVVLQPAQAQAQVYQSQIQQYVQGPLQQQGPAKQFQNQSPAQQNQSLMGQLQQVAQDQVQQAVAQQLTQTQSTQAQQFQPQAPAQSMLEQQQALNQQTQQQLQQIKLQAQHNFNQQLQQQIQQQQMASRPAPQPSYAQTQPNLLDQAISVFQQSTQQQQTISVDQIPTQTLYMDSSPAQAIYIDQAPAQTPYVDQSAVQQTTFINETAYTLDQTFYTDATAAGDVNVELNIERNVYFDQEQSCIVQEEAFNIEDGSCEQVYELQDDGCADRGHEVDAGDGGGFEDAGFDF